MANKKISELPEVTSPASSDVLPIVSGGVTSKVQARNLPAGRYTYATGTLTLAAQPTAGDTMTLGSTVYTFLAVPVVQFDIEIGANLAATQANLVLAINGLDIFATFPQEVFSALAFSGNNLALSAFEPGTAGNSLATTETFTSGLNFFGAATLAGGTDGTSTGGIKAQHIIVQDLTPHPGERMMAFYDVNGNLVIDIDNDGGVIFGAGNVIISGNGITQITYDTNGAGPTGNAIFRFFIDNQTVFVVAPGSGITMGVNSQLPGDITLSLNPAYLQTADAIATYDPVDFNKAFRVLPYGAIVTAQHAAPADGDLAAGDLAMWYDQDDVTPAVKFKSKTANGTVKTATVLLT